MMHTAKPIEAVSVLDEAIDHARSDVKKYAETRELAHLHFLPGKEPTRFFLRRIPASLAAHYVHTTDTVSVQRYRAFQAALVRAKNWTDINGEHHTEWTPTRKTKLGDDQMLVAEETDLFHGSDRDEMGSLAVQIGFFRSGSAHSYELPLSLAAALESPAFRSAAQKASSAATNSEPLKALPADQDLVTSA